MFPRSIFEKQVYYGVNPDPTFTMMTFRQVLDALWVDEVQTPHETFNNGLVHTPQNLWLVHCLFRP